MGAPQFDKNGYALPYDDPDVADADELVRHIHPTMVVDDPKKPGGRRLSSGCFKSSSTPHRGISVNVERLVFAGGRLIEELVPENHGFAKIRAEVPRRLDLLVGQHALPENPFHAEIWARNSAVTKSASRALALAAQIVTFPT